MSKIAKIYFTSCMRGEKNFKDVPKKLQAEVKQLIKDEGYTVNRKGTVELPKPKDE